MNDIGITRIIAVGEIITGIGVMLFWVMFFFGGMVPENPPHCYFAYEHSFPLPDSVMAVGCIVAGYLLLNGKALGGSLSLVCAGALIFLGLLDFSFNLQNGVYRLSTGELISNGFINLWCVIFGGLTVVVLARRR